ncbi:MAG TPA: MFS transporter [Conexibacter sp.]|nr:MFS transporter [Conexibacter sp.]
MKGAAAPPWVVAFGLVLACSWGNNQFTPLMVLYRERYSTLAVNLFLAVSVAGLTVSLLTSGALSDRCGRRPVMVAGALAAIAASGGLALSATGPLAICVGRLFAGLAIGTAMAVGTTWLKELSQAPLDRRAQAGAGARRASAAFTAGSAAGALAAGALAQWAPWGAQLPFLTHIAMMLPLTWLAARTPETVDARGWRRDATDDGRARGGPRTPRRARRRPARPTPRTRRVPPRRLTRPARRTLLLVVLLPAPWLFAGAAVAYGYLPLLLSGAAGGLGLAYAGLLAATTHGTAALLQPLMRTRRLRASAHGPAVALAIVAAGLLLVAATVARGSLALGLLAAVVLGAGLGVGLVSCLLDLQRVAGRDRLATLTGRFYVAAYAGFLLPAAMAATPVPTTTLLLVLVALAVVTAAVVARATTRR